MICSKCKEDITTCDGGYAHKFKLKEKIICWERKMPRGSLHFCDEHEYNDFLLEEGYDDRGKNAIVESKEESK